MKAERLPLSESVCWVRPFRPAATAKTCRPLPMASHQAMRLPWGPDPLRNVVAGKALGLDPAPAEDARLSAGPARLGTGVWSVVCRGMALVAFLGSCVILRGRAAGSGLIRIGPRILPVRQSELCGLAQRTLCASPVHCPAFCQSCTGFGALLGGGLGWLAWAALLPRRAALARGLLDRCRCPARNRCP